MRATEFISEIGNSFYDVEKTSGSSPSKNLRIKHAKGVVPFTPKTRANFKFKTDSGTEYVIHLSMMKSPKNGRTGVEVVFADANEEEDIAITNKGDAIKVFSTVKNVIAKFISEHPKVSVVAFSAKTDEPSRVKLYQTFANQFTRWFPNFSEQKVFKHPDYTTFAMMIPQTKNVEEEITDEMALQQFTPMGDFDKPGPFRGVDKRLVPHPTNQLKTAKFFEQTPYNFRLFFSNIPGTGKYSEIGPVNAEKIQEIFGEQAQQIIQGSEDSITVVFVGNKGDSRVMMTPWIMAHRFGHAVQAGVRRNSGWHAWLEAEKHFFKTVNTMLEKYYGKIGKDEYYTTSVKWNLTPEYNALFNSIGTQRSSRSGQIKRPYEFLYEIFAQYLGTGQVTFNPLPTTLGYGRKNWGNPSKYLNIKSAYRYEEDQRQATETLANDMQYMFDDVMSSSVGQIFVM